MIKDISGFLNDMYSLIRSHTRTAIIGMSGGADSTLVSILCAQALGANRTIGIHMPYGEIDETYFNHRSKIIADRLDIMSYTVPIGHQSIAFNQKMEEAFGHPLSKLNGGNTRARMRMMVLYCLAHGISEDYNTKARVVGTGNLSEDYIGYDTKWGDSAADFFPIGNLFKSEVYQLLDYFKQKDVITEDMIDRNPSAGLWVGQTDEEELGYNYNEMEEAIRYFMKYPEQLHQKQITKMYNFVAERHLNNLHKHSAVPVLDLRQYCD